MEVIKIRNTTIDGGIPIMEAYVAKREAEAVRAFAERVKAETLNLARLIANDSRAKSIHDCEGLTTRTEYVQGMHRYETILGAELRATGGEQNPN